MRVSSIALAPGLRSRPPSPSEVAEGLRRTGSGCFGGVGKEAAILFLMSDKPVLDALSFYREEAET